MRRRIPGIRPAAEGNGWSWRELPRADLVPAFNGGLAYYPDRGPGLRAAVRLRRPVGLLTLAEGRRRPYCESALSFAAPKSGVRRNDSTALVY